MSTDSSTPVIVSLRPATGGDEPFLRQLYRSTLKQQMAAAGLPEAQIAGILDLQFKIQDLQYRQKYTDAAFDIVLSGEEPIGRLYVDRRERETKVIEISLLPDWRNKGIGSSLLQGILNERKKVQLCVEVANPALRLYFRLGFREEERSGIHLWLIWEPSRV
jgi:ribosomal protein S18 acetylase RimI-like enzyme